MPSFTPKTDKELAADNLLPAGEYDFEILGAEDKTFKTGSQGIALKVGVFTSSGAQRFVNDNLIFQDNCLFKVSQFCKCVGLYDRYKSGQLDAEDCRNRAGKCKVGIEPEGEYPAKNKISSYVIPKANRSEIPNSSAPKTAGVPVIGQTADLKPDDDGDSVPF